MSQTTPKIARVVIDGPENNLLNPTVMSAVADDLKHIDADGTVDAILLTGAGDAFCGGLDLAGIRAGGDPVEYARSLAELLKLFPKLSKPIAACDYAVARPDAMISSYEVAVGVWPMVAQVPLIKRLGARTAMENIGSGDPFTAERAQQLGLVNAVAEAGEVCDLAEHWLTRAARGGAANAGRVFFYEIAELPYDTALDMTLQKFAAQFEEA